MRGPKSGAFAGLKWFINTEEEAQNHASCADFVQKTRVLKV